MRSPTLTCAEGTIASAMIMYLMRRVDIVKQRYWNSLMV
jgi:hypothetical protein